MKRKEHVVAKQATRPITAIIVSDSHIIRSGLRKILESQPGFRILAEMSIEKALETHPIPSPHVNLFIIDLDPRGADGLPVIRALQKGQNKPAVLVLIDLGDHALGAQALSLGATGLVLKMQPTSVLLAAIYELCPPSGFESIRKSETSDRAGTKIQNQGGLRPRLIALGLKNKDIAKKLAISDITVRHHLTSIYCKLEVADRQKLLILAHRHGLVDFSLRAESA